MDNQSDQVDSANKGGRRMVLRRDYIGVGVVKGVVAAGAIAFGTHAVLETYSHDWWVKHPLHSPSTVSIVVSTTSASTLTGLHSVVAAVSDHLEYTRDAFTTDLAKDLNFVARHEAWIPPTVK